MKKLTPKQRVLKVYPEAFAYRWAGPSPWVIYRPYGGNLSGNLSLNTAAKTAAQAWAEAWRALATNCT